MILQGRHEVKDAAKCAGSACLIRVISGCSAFNPLSTRTDLVL